MNSQLPIADSQPFRRVPVDLDDLLTVEQFAAWRQEPVSSVRKRLASMPGVVRESRENVRVHPRTYLEGRLGKKGGKKL